MNEDEKRILHDCELEIQSIKSWISKNAMDSNIKFLVSYAVIKATGTIEIVFKSMINTFLAQNCIDETKRYLETQIVDSSVNPSAGMIERYLEQFDVKRKNQFSSLLKNSQDKGNLKNLVALRNNIAHGRTANTTISEVETYFLSGKQVLEFLEKVLINEG